MGQKGDMILEAHMTMILLDIRLFVQENCKVEARILNREIVNCHNATIQRNPTSVAQGKQICTIAAKQRGPHLTPVTLKIITI